MEPSIRNVVISGQRLNPAESELHIVVHLDAVTPGTMVRGRLVGPRCPYASTVEVAYPLREIARGATSITVRAIVPEPCFWEPQSPFLYEGLVELWRDGQRREQQTLRHGFHHVELTPAGLRLNGKPFAVVGRRGAPAGEDEARRWHDAGVNLLLLERPEAGALDLADRYGFLVLARRSAGHGGEPASHPSFMAWVDSPESVQGSEKMLVGVELREAPTRPLPPTVTFVLCRSEDVGALAALELPKVVVD